MNPSVFYSSVYYSSGWPFQATTPAAVPLPTNVVQYYPAHSLTAPSSSSPPSSSNAAPYQPLVGRPNAKFKVLEAYIIEQAGAARITLKNVSHEIIDVKNLEITLKDSPLGYEISTIQSFAKQIFDLLRLLNRIGFTGFEMSLYSFFVTRDTKKIFFTQDNLGMRSDGGNTLELCELNCSKGTPQPLVYKPPEELKVTYKGSKEQKLNDNQRPRIYAINKNFASCAWNLAIVFIKMGAKSRVSSVELRSLSNEYNMSLQRLQQQTEALASQIIDTHFGKEDQILLFKFKSLIIGLLQREPQRRFTLDQIGLHPFLQIPSPLIPEARRAGRTLIGVSSPQITPSTLEAQKHIRQSAMAFIACNAGVPYLRLFSPMPLQRLLQSPVNRETLRSLAQQLFFMWSNLNKMRISISNLRTDNIYLNSEMYFVIINNIPIGYDIHAKKLVIGIEGEYEKPEPTLAYTTPEEALKVLDLEALKALEVVDEKLFAALNTACMWKIGAILYELFMGKRLIPKEMEGHPPHYTPAIKASLSTVARSKNGSLQEIILFPDFVENLLWDDPSARLSSERFSKHLFMKPS